MIQIVDTDRHVSPSLDTRPFDAIGLRIAGQYLIDQTVVDEPLA